jgi:hypothetical protein
LDKVFEGIGVWSFSSTLKCAPYPRSVEATPDFLPNWAIQQENPNSENYFRAGKQGDACLVLAGSWVDLIIAMRYFWETKHGSHFAGLFDPCMKKIAPHQGMLHLARSVAQAGIDAR